METIHIKAYPTNESEIDAINSFMKTLKIKFELRRNGDSPYNPEFIAKIRKGEKDLLDGKGIGITVQELENLCK